MTMTTTVTELAGPASWRPVDTGESAVAVAERAALGTSARVAVWPPGSLDPALAAADRVLAALDQQASRFRADSEISWLHRAGGGLFMISDGLAEAIGVALAAARWTGGLVDPTVGDALISLGYDRDFAAIDPACAGPPGPPVPAPGWHTVRLDRSLLRLPEGVRLDLGATAKALGSDRAAGAAFAAAGRSGGVLVSLGGDIAVAGQPPRGGWPILVSDTPDPAGQARTQRIPAGPRGSSHVLDQLPPMAAGRPAAPPHHRPADRPPGGRPLAHGKRRGGELRRRQRRRNGSCRRRRAGRGLAGRGPAAGQARLPRRRRAVHQRLAG